LAADPTRPSARNTPVAREMLLKLLRWG
jgi:hypothetical protein